MTGLFRHAEKIAKLVALGKSPNAAEAESAIAKARDLIRQTDLQFLATIQGQRTRLLEKISAEQHRLGKRNTRPNAGTRDLLDSAALLLSHYQRIDFLRDVVILERLAAGEPELRGDETSEREWKGLGW